MHAASVCFDPCRGAQGDPPQRPAQHRRLRAPPRPEVRGWCNECKRRGSKVAVTALSLPSLEAVNLLNAGAYPPVTPVPPPRGSGGRRFKFGRPDCVSGCPATSTLQGTFHFSERPGLVLTYFTAASALLVQPRARPLQPCSRRSDEIQFPSKLKRRRPCIMLAIRTFALQSSGLPRQVSSVYT
jgi:hypothetical protein